MIYIYNIIYYIWNTWILHMFNQPQLIKNFRFHPGKFPLLAACSDDATVSILHAKVTPGLGRSQSSNERCDMSDMSDMWFTCVWTFVGHGKALGNPLVNEMSAFVPVQWQFPGVYPGISYGISHFQTEPCDVWWMADWTCKIIRDYVIICDLPGVPQVAYGMAYGMVAIWKSIAF